MATCATCGGDVQLQNNPMRGELIECNECGSELEVVNTDPVELAEAPTEEEDWGQ